MTSGFFNKRFTAIVLWVLLVMTNREAVAMGFFVRPTKVNIRARRGETKEVLIDVLNKTPDSNQVLDVVNVALVQGMDGGFNIVDLQNPPKGIPERFVDCSHWIKPQRPFLDIPPLTTEKLLVKVTIPTNASGTYLGGIVIQSRPTNTTGMGISLRFLVRFEIMVVGTSARSSVKIENSGLGSRKNEETKKVTEFANVLVNNNGDVPVNIEGSFSLSQQSGNKWRKMMSLSIKPIRSYPGSRFWVGTELPRRIPTGKYRLDYNLSADGKRIATPGSDIDFKGDPKVGSLVADAEIQISPDFQLIEAGERSKRTIRSLLINDGDQILDISIHMEQLASLRGVSIGDKLGDDISCPDWFQIKRPNIQLRPHSSRPFVCSVICPDSNLTEATYYAQMVVNAKYSDGQKAGTVNSVLAVGIKNIELNPDFRLTKMSLTKDDKGENTLIVNSANIGNRHVFPHAKVIIKNLSETRIFLNKELQGPETWVFPFGTPTFYSNIDISQIPLGEYKLFCEVTYDGGGNNLEKTISIYEESGTRKIKLFEPGSNK